MRVVPLYVRFGEESFRDYVELGPDDFYDRLRDGADAADDLAADAAGLPHGLRGARGLRAHPLAPHRVEPLGHVRERRLAAQELGGDRVRLIDTRTASAAIAMLALAIQRRLERGTTDEEIEALARALPRDAGLLFTVDTLEFLAKAAGSAGRARSPGSC